MTGTRAQHARHIRDPILLAAALALPLLVCGLVSPAAATTYPGFMNLITDSSLTLVSPNTAKPLYLAPLVEPTFGSKVTRIAGDPTTSFAPSSVSGTWGDDARHHYSKDQPWSADGSLIALQNSGSPSVVYLDGENYQVKYGKCSSYSPGDDRWHPSPAHAHERINVSGTKVEWYDVVQCKQTRVFTLPFSVNYFGMGEGNPSFDGRYVALSDGTNMFVLDMDPQPPFAPYPNYRVGPAVPVNECGLTGGCTVDWVSISPSGKYAVVSYDGDFPRVFDVNPTTLALTPRPMPAASSRCHGTAALGFIYDLGHADMTLNPFDGNEDVLIGQEHCGNRGHVVDGKVMSGVVMVRLKDDLITPLTEPNNEAYPHHISARCYDRPGWVYAGYHYEAGKKFSDEIVAVKMDGSKSIQRFAFKHSAYSGCYRCEAHSVPSRDGRRVLWASNWALNCTTCGASSDIKAYVVDARSGAIQPDTIPPTAPKNLTAR